jgi:hypothetical protein
MKDCIKSKFNKDIYFPVFLIAGSSLSFGLFLFKIINNFTGKTGEVLGILLFLGLLLMAFCCFLKHIKYIIIKDNRLKYYSIFFPLGKTLYFTDFIGKITTSEIAGIGEYTVIYLVNKQNQTIFKITGSLYKNFDEINNAIQLKKISFSPTVGQYFKLLFFERITIPDKKTQKQAKSKDSGQSIAKICAVIATVGVALYVFRMLVEILSKLI